MFFHYGYRSPRSVCFSCRKVFAPRIVRFGFDSWGHEKKCPDCGRIMVWKYNFKAPRRNDVKAWKQLSVG